MAQTNLNFLSPKIKVIEKEKKRAVKVVQKKKLINPENICDDCGKFIEGKDTRVINEAGDKYNVCIICYAKYIEDWKLWKNR